MTVDLGYFHASQWPKSISSPSEYDGSESLSINLEIGRKTEAQKKAVLKAWIAALPGFDGLKRLQLWCRVTPPFFEAACQLNQLEVLRIKWSNLQQVDAITNLQQLKALFIGSSSRIHSIEPLSTLTSLVALEIENFKLISDFAALQKLRNLKHLAVTGSMWSRQAIGNLEPFAAMTWLSSLHLDTAHVTSLRPLARLTALRELGLGGHLSHEEYAWLSAKLPNTECRWFRPYYDMAEMGFGQCKICGHHAKVMLTGKAPSTVCKHCDAQKVERHIKVFEAARAAAANEA